MSETVYIPTTGNSSDRHMHRDPNCDGLDMAGNVVEKDRAVLFEDQARCSLCWDREELQQPGMQPISEQDRFEPPVGELTERIHVRLGSETNQRLDDRADRAGTTASEEARIAIQRHLEFAETYPDDLPYVLSMTGRSSRKTLRLSGDQMQRLKELTARRDSSLSGEARTAIVHYLEHTYGRGETT